MTTVSNINSSSSTSSTSTSGSATSTASALGASMTQADFLKLLTAQLQAQDPTNPVDNSQFVSQMAQFSTLSATQDLNTSLTSLSSSVNSALQTSQVLSSASLVGRSVMVPSTTLDYSGTAISGATSVVSTGDVHVQIKDAAGNVVRDIDLGTQQAGLAQFSWDGLDDNGNAVASGSYTMSAYNQGSSSATLSTYVAGKVTGVGYGGTDVGTYVQVAGIGGVPLSSVAQIN